MATGLWLQAQELGFGNLFSYPPPTASRIFLSLLFYLTPSFNHLSLDTLTVKVDLAGVESVQLESCISAPEASSSAPTFNCSSSAVGSATLGLSVLASGELGSSGGQRSSPLSTSLPSVGSTTMEGSLLDSFGYLSWESGKICLKLI